MSQITSHRIGELLQNVLDLLWNRAEGMLASEIFIELTRKCQLNEYERGYYPTYPGIPRYQVAIRLGTNALSHAGWLIKNNKGRWFITEAGRQACKQFNNAQEFYKEAMRLYNEWQTNHRVDPLSIEGVQEKAWLQIKKYIQSLNAFEFQFLVKELLIAMGQHIIWEAPHNKDHGQVHMIVSTDPLGFNNSRTIVQIKHKGQAATAEGLKSFQAAVSSHNHGLLISSGGFTHDARETLILQGAQHVTLLDMEEFVDLWIEYFERLSIEAQLRFPVKAIHFLSPSER
ncbi:MAG: restriction endonuclease [Anaerolineales bacterium]|nr:restriction endonuclease [Anaerolineales bacterium]